MLFDYMHVTTCATVIWHVHPIELQGPSREDQDQVLTNMGCETPTADRHLAARRSALLPTWVASPVLAFFLCVLCHQVVAVDLFKSDRMAGTYFVPNSTYWRTTCTLFATPFTPTTTGTAEVMVLSISEGPTYSYPRGPCTCRL